MNKLQASKIIQAYQDYRHGDDYSLYPIPEFGDIDDALDFAIKELGKDDSKYEAEIMAGKILAGVYKNIRDTLPPPSFAGTCTKCGEPSTKPEYTLCTKHFDLWQESKKERPNYRYLVNVNSPKEVRDYYNIGDIYSNIGECPKCGDIIESLNHYDYTKCSCGHSFIDGGSDYMRCNPDLINLSVGFNQK